MALTVLKLEKEEEVEMTEELEKLNHKIEKIEAHCCTITAQNFALEKHLRVEDGRFKVVEDILSVQDP